MHLGQRVNSDVHIVMCILPVVSVDINTISYHWIANRTIIIATTVYKYHATDKQLLHSPNFINYINQTGFELPYVCL